MTDSTLSQIAHVTPLEWIEYPADTNRHYPRGAHLFERSRKDGRYSYGAVMPSTAQEGRLYAQVYIRPLTVEYFDTLEEAKRFVEEKAANRIADENVKDAELIPSTSPDEKGKFMSNTTERPRNCPTCESPAPERHPAVQFEGEVHLCKNEWHNFGDAPFDREELKRLIVESLRFDLHDKDNPKVWLELKNALDYAEAYRSASLPEDESQKIYWTPEALKAEAASLPVQQAQPPHSDEIWIRRIEHGEQPIRWGVYFGSECAWDFPENERHMAYALADNLGRILRLNTYDESSEFSASLRNTSLAPEGFPESRVNSPYSFPRAAIGEKGAAPSPLDQAFSAMATDETYQREAEKVRESMDRLSTSGQEIAQPQQIKPTLPVGVSVLLVDTAGRVLLGERMNNTASGMFSTPGGRIEKDEDMIDCATRETLEETGLAVDAEDVKIIGFKEHFRFGGHYIMFYAEVRRWTGTLTNTEPHKCKSWQWFHLDAIPENCTEPKDILCKLSSRAHSPAVQALESQWIRVEDKLPCDYQTVLIATTEGHIEMARHCPADDNIRHYSWELERTGPQNDAILLDRDQVTHWAELPAPPVESLSKSKAQEE